MRKATILISIIAFIMLAGCTASYISERNYYILEYYKHSEDTNLISEKPIEATVLVNDAEISRTYSKNKIVIRHFGPKITYSENENWAIKISEIVPELIAKRLNSYNTFTLAKREYQIDNPDYEIVTKVNNIEVYESEFGRNAAHLNIDISLIKYNSEVAIVKHSANREKFLLQEDTETFVQEVNLMILEETDNFIKKVNLAFSNKKYDENSLNPDNQIATNLESELEEHDDENLQDGMGLLLLPALSKTDDEPHYKIYDEFGLEFDGQVGKPIPLETGKYSIRFGSGEENMWMEKENIEILPHFKTIVKPDWGNLIIKIIDEKRNTMKVRYEVFDPLNSNSYGSEYPAEEEIGEIEKIWLLRPGLYKITINNEPVNTYTNFTTVYVKEGEIQQLTLVVDTDDNGNPTDLIGAGIIEGENIATASDIHKFYNAIHGNATFTSSNREDKNKPSTDITINGQFDSKYIFDMFPYYFTSKANIGISTTKTRDTDMRVSSSELDLRNTLIYYFTNSVGLYTRADLNTEFLELYKYGTEEDTLTIYDYNGVEKSIKKNKKKLRLNPFFYPMSLKQGVGVNWRIINSAKANVNFRTGYGLRQNFYNNVITAIDDNSYEEKKDNTQQGMEISLVSNYQLPFRVTLNSNADVLIPFDSNNYLSYEWENVLNMKFIKGVSLDYTFKINKNEEIDDYIVTDHEIFLRLTYIIH